jgi:hypothetical protein
MTLSVTIERFFAIVYPLKRIQLKSSLITTSIITAILYNIPRFFEFEKIYRHISTTNDHNETINNTVRRLMVTGGLGEGPAPPPRGFEEFCYKTAPPPAHENILKNPLLSSR